jgi:hypothetical protein
MTRAYFDQVADALRGFLPSNLRAFDSTVSARNLKVWFGADRHEHYEVQSLSRGVRVPGKPRGSYLEIGFHAEHPAPQRNDDVLERLRARERTWRRTLGRSPEAGPFLGRARDWRRISEVWDGPGLDSEEAAIEAAERLSRYIRALERLRTAAREL